MDFCFLIYSTEWNERTENIFSFISRFCTENTGIYFVELELPKSA